MPPTTRRRMVLWTFLAAAPLAGRASAQPGQPDSTSPPSAAPTPAAKAGGYRLEAGPWKVETTRDLVLKDAARNKDLHVRVFVPVASPPAATNSPATPTTPGAPTIPMPPAGRAGAFPLVVFSHGLGGSKDVFPELCRHWASWGYVVVSPTHADSIAERRAKGEKVTRDTAFDISRMGPQGQQGRVDDVKLILDSLDVLESKAAGLGAGAIDRERLAMAGHSAGAHTTMVLTGTRLRRVGGALWRPVDPRFKASIVVSGQGVNGRSLRDDAWDQVSVPMLVITGSLDSSPITDETPAQRRHPFEKSRGVAGGGPPAYLLWIEGATHSSFGGRGVTAVLRESPTTPVPVIQDAVAATTLAFLDAHLRGESGGSEYLAGNHLPALTGGKADLKAK